MFVVGSPAWYLGHLPEIRHRLWDSAAISAGVLPLTEATAGACTSGRPGPSINSGVAIRGESHTKIKSNPWSKISSKGGHRRLCVWWARPACSIWAPNYRGSQAAETRLSAQGPNCRPSHQLPHSSGQKCRLPWAPTSFPTPVGPGSAFLVRTHCRCRLRGGPAPCPPRGPQDLQVPFSVLSEGKRCLQYIFGKNIHLLTLRWTSAISFQCLPPK